jgi:hypothetical protein
MGGCTASVPRVGYGRVMSGDRDVAELPASSTPAPSPNCSLLLSYPGANDRDDP